MKVSDFYGREMPAVPSPAQLGIELPEKMNTPGALILLWLVLVEEAELVNGRAVVWTSQREIAKAALCSRPTARRGLDFWLERGFIEHADGGLELKARTR